MLKVYSGKKRRLISPEPSQLSPLTELSSDDKVEPVNRRLFSDDAERNGNNEYDLNDPFMLVP
jgi:hypothetical protein